MSAARIVRAGTLASCLLVTGWASGQSAASSAAETLFREGKAFAAQKRWDEAIAKFRASEDLEASVGVLLSLGDAYDARGRPASALSSYELARDLAKSKNDARAADAEQRIAGVAPRVPHLTVRVVAAAGSIAITEDGLVMPPASYGSALPVDPGSHVLVANAKGRRPFKTTVSLVEGQSYDVLVPELEPESPVAERDTDTTRKTASTALIVGGGAATVLGLVFGGIAISDWSTVKDRCPGRTCASVADRDAVQGRADAANGFAVASTAAIVTGVVAAGIGVALALTRPDRGRAAGVLEGRFP